MSSFVDGSPWLKRTVEVQLIHRCGMAAIDGSDRQTSLTFGAIAAWRRRTGSSNSLGAVGAGLMEACPPGRREICCRCRHADRIVAPALASVPLPAAFESSLRNTPGNAIRYSLAEHDVGETVFGEAEDRAAAALQLFYASRASSAMI
jgi:hypothetical protein